ncbi:bacteriocin fulvocin C-related protein [Corallococcus carmarthensis]|uniref:Bacteriocin fulvocin C-related protein n=1 Tax=Corallococcus carmarthensis TaxID=2316728 RepID=A0A3A8JJY5_9BACT|nr:bacteriocin fulvocin C-related protein [Corallococcus carmarthensis]RKG96092.1 hypothetical protein D7X32_37065 [Corallococcus carmarthensis]
MLLLLGVAILGVGTLLFPLPASASESCTAAQKHVQDWVDANAGHLPTDLDGVSRHPVAYRKAIFAALSADQKVSLWREHIRQYVAAHPKLSTQQAAVLESVFARLTSELFSQAGHAQLDLMEKQVKDAFGAEEAVAIVATLGPVEAPEAVPPALAPLCQCSRASPYCGSLACRAYKCTTQSGCGTFYQFRCDGLCG